MSNEEENIQPETATKLESNTESNERQAETTHLAQTIQNDSQTKQQPTAEENDTLLDDFAEGKITGTAEQIIPAFLRNFEAYPHLAPTIGDWQRMSAQEQARLLEKIRIEMQHQKRKEQMTGDMEKRKKANPTMTEVEKHLGHYIEQEEPQLRQAIQTFTEKGYLMGKGMKGGEFEDTQSISMFSIVDKDTIEKLRNIGVRVDGIVRGSIAQEDTGLTELSFPSSVSLQEMTVIWNRIAEILPDKGHMADYEGMRRRQKEWEQSLPPGELNRLMAVWVESKTGKMGISSSGLENKLEEVNPDTNVEKAKQELFVIYLIRQIINGIKKGIRKPKEEVLAA